MRAGSNRIPSRRSSTWRATDCAAWTSSARASSPIAWRRWKRSASARAGATRMPAASRWRSCPASTTRRSGLLRSQRSAPEQALELVERVVTRAALPRLAAAAPGRGLIAAGLRLGNTEPFLESALDPLARLRARELRRGGRIVDLVLERVERTDEVHGNGEALQLREIRPALALGRRHHRGVGDVIDRRVADVDVALSRDAEERRLHVEVLVVRDAVLDVEARGHLGEVGLLRFARLLLLLGGAERRLRAAEHFREVDALDRAVLERDVRS